jgi:hypothetical protein
MYELKLIAKAFLKYGMGWCYLYYRFWVARQMLWVKEIEKPVTHPELSIHMLFGARDFLMALWSLASFYRVSSVRGALYLHSDGTLIDTHRVTLARLFPNAVFVDARTVLTDNKTFFDSHPDLKQFREQYRGFQSKKLLDPFLASNATYRLILDSDMLWFKDPTELRACVEARVPRPLMMSDRTGQGGRSYVTFTDGTRISEDIAACNSGVTLYRKDQFNLDVFSAYLAKTDYLHKKFTDQACYATILNPTLLPEERYIIKGALTDTIVMRHYTNPSRAKFYCYGLNFIARDILAACAQ